MNATLIPLAFASIGCFGQIQPQDGTHFGLIISPDYCYRHTGAAGDEDMKIVKEVWDSTERPRFGFTAGLSVKRRIGERLLLESGLLFSDKGERIPRREFGFIDTTVPVALSSRYRYLYIDVPVVLNYVVTRGRVALFVVAGISLNVFLTHVHVSIAEYSDGSVVRGSHSTREPLSSFNPAALAGIGVDAQLSECLGIRLEPVYRHSIIPIADTPLKRYLYSAGVNIGLYWRPACK